MGRYWNGGHNKTKFCYEDMYYISIKDFKHSLKYSLTHNLILYQKLDCEVNKNYLYIKEYNQKINIFWKKCNYGKERAFFICPVCNKKYLKLVYMQDNNFACRNCNNANYKSSRESKKWLKISRLIKNLSKLKFIDKDNEILDIKDIYKSSFFTPPVNILLDRGIRRIKQIPKPKYMHYKKYNNILKECINNLIDIYIYCFKLDKYNNNNIINDISKTLENYIGDFYKYNSPEYKYSFYGKIQTHETIRNKNGIWIKRKEKNQVI